MAIHDVEDEEILKISDFRNDVEAKFSDWTLTRLRGLASHDPRSKYFY